MFLFDVLGICFEGVRDFLLLLCCYFVVLVFGKELSFGPTCLLCLHSLDALSFLFVFVIFLVFRFVWVFLGSVFFLSSFWFVFLHCCVVVLVFLLHVLAARLSLSLSGFFGLPSHGNSLGESFENGRPGGVIVFLFFS